MDNIIHPFQIPIYQSFIDEKSFIQIKEDTDNFINKNFNLFKDKWDCPTLTTQGIPIEQNIKSNKLVEEIQYHVQNFWNVWKFTTVKELSIKEIWVNISKKGSYQEVHDHGDYLFSGTIYTNVDKHSGDFVLQSPLSVEHILNEMIQILLA
jgi:hypothetical protein